MINTWKIENGENKKKGLTEEFKRRRQKEEYKETTYFVTSPPYLHSVLKKRPLAHVFGLKV
jgi:hypothetical protein